MSPCVTRKSGIAFYIEEIRGDSSLPYVIKRYAITEVRKSTSADFERVTNVVDSTEGMILPSLSRTGVCVRIVVCDSL